MKENNIIAEKSFAFAVIAIDTYKLLRYDRKEFVMSTQFLRSSTSIAANIEEAIGAQSTRDFLHKISISYKEARETKLWIRLIKHAEYITPAQADSLLHKVEELCRILGKIQLSIKEKL
ncbi:MAG: four helix bundle protein [Saprospiraceae bacterium]